MANGGGTTFTRLLTKLARVPKAEIDEQERKEAKKFKARKTHKAYAKPGQIVRRSGEQDG